MNVKVTSLYDDTAIESLIDKVAKELLHTDEAGAVEILERQLSNSVNAIAVLIDILSANKLITSEQLKDLLGDNYGEEYEFTEEEV